MNHDRNSDAHAGNNDTDTRAVALRNALVARAERDRYALAVRLTDAGYADDDDYGYGVAFANDGRTNRRSLRDRIQSLRGRTARVESRPALGRHRASSPAPGGSPRGLPPSPVLTFAGALPCPGIVSGPCTCGRGDC